MAITELPTDMVCTRTGEHAAETDDDDFLFELIKPDTDGDEFVDAGSAAAVACYCCCYCRVAEA